MAEVWRPKEVRHGGAPPIEIETLQAVWASADPHIANVHADMRTYLEQNPCECEDFCHCDCDHARGICGVESSNS